MPKVLVERKYNSRRNNVRNCDRFGFSSGRMRISLISLSTLVLAAILFSGLFYLYQVNDLATKGFEIKEAESRIESLQEERKKLKIKETELKSMYNLEREIKDMNLVNCSNISYIEYSSPLAMK